ncbi:MAG: LPXTG cell wall anchor domain-containing protein [Muricoprocola sp.]
MKRNTILISRCFSGLLTLSLIMNPIAVYAEDGFMDEFPAEAESLEENVDNATFIIDSFPDFQKDSDEIYIDEEIREKYSEIKAVPGTSMEDLELPEELVLEGYWESDPEQMVTYHMEDLNWKLKSDTDEIYSESSPEGEYIFIPDYDDYVLNHDDVDAFTLAENTKDLELKVTIVAKEASPENEDSLDEESLSLDDSSSEDEILMEGIDVITEDFVPYEENTFTEETVVPDGSEDSVPTDEKDSLPEENIFENLDSDVITEDSVEFYQPDEEEPQTELQTESESEIPFETEITSEEEIETELLETEEAANDAITDYKGAYYFSVDGFMVYHYPEGTEMIPVTEGTNVVSLTVLPCDTDMKNLSVSLEDNTDTTYQFTDEYGNTVFDFSDGESKTLYFTQDNGITYSATFTLKKEKHQWTEATCTELATCEICGKTKGDYADHISAGNETCTKNATCKVCGEEIPGTKLGHNWKAATCTTPKTCKRCNAEKGSALGHDLRDDWEVIEYSTETTHGYQQRYCHRDSCDYAEKLTLNIIGDPQNNGIADLYQGADYDLNTKLTFTAYGAGMQNTDPINGDVRYLPSSWTIQGSPGTFMEGYTGAFSISKAGTYTVTVAFQKQEYQNGWSSTSIADSKSVTFTVGGVTTDGTTDSVRINPSTGDSSPVVPLAIAIVASLMAMAAVLFYRKKHTN